MENRKFDKNILHIFASHLIESSNQVNYSGDLSDLGNEIGYQLPRLYANWTDEDTENILAGVKHGIDLRIRELKLKLK